MTKKEEYTGRVQECITAITKEVENLVFKGKSKMYKERMICVVIKDEARKFKLKHSFIKAIYLGKLN